MGTYGVADKVRIRPASPHGALRQGQVGQVIAVHNPPAQGGPIVDIQFDDGVERGIRIAQIEHAKA